MSDMQQNLVLSLSQAATQLQMAGLPSELVGQMEQLVEQVDQPCVVAVVGRVKAGKSTLLNAFLGEALAKVGTTETTATINYFRYGFPNDPERPVRCYWRGGGYTEVERHFLNELQAHDAETLRRAEGIKYLEYHLPNASLKEVTLVDTPGTGAVVDAHQNRTAEFMRLSQQLRERHAQETEALGNTADAVIYVIGEVARATDRAFLDAFQQATQGKSRALNAIGVMAKIDLHPDIMSRRTELAEKMAQQLKKSLNTVIPVSAGLRCALDRLLQHHQAGLLRMMALLRTIPPQRLTKLLDNEAFYLDFEYPDCPVSTEQREELLADMPWAVFTTIARVAADSNLDATAVVAQLNALTGFEQLRAVLAQHFFKRAKFLRSYRIVRDALQVLSTIKYRYEPQIRQQNRQEKAKLRRFLSFIRQGNGDPAVAQELERYLQERLAERRVPLKTIIEQLEREFSRLRHQLEEYNADFQALQQMETHTDLFSVAERDELRALLGLYGIESNKRLSPANAKVAYIAQRQQFWRQIEQMDRRDIRREVAQRAVYRYGVMLNELE